MKHSQHKRRTGVVSRAEQPLFLTGEYDKLYIRAKLDTEAFDCTCNGQKACRSGAVVVTARRSRAAKRTSAVIVRTNEDRLGGVLCRRVTASSRTHLSRDVLRGGSVRGTRRTK